MKKNKITIAIKLAHARNAFSDKNQKRVFSLGLIAMNQERLRLYEELPDGKAAAAEMSEEEKKEHFKNFLPDVGHVNRECTFSIEYLMRFTGLQESSLYKTIGKAARTIHRKGISFESSIDGGKVTGGFSPIYDGEYSTVHGLKFRVAERAVTEMMNHSKGFNEVDIRLFTELDSVHSIKLLEIISGHKRSGIYPWKLDTFRYRFNVDCKRFESEEHIQECISAGGYRMDDAEVGDKIFDQDGNVFPIYPAVKDLKRRVITPAFKEIIDKSCGMWTPTDEKGLGYELIKTGKKYTHIKFCLKYNPNADSLPFDEPKPIEHEKIEEAVIVEPKVDSALMIMESIAKEMVGNDSGLSEGEVKALLAKALHEHLSKPGGVIEKYKAAKPEEPKITKAEDTKSVVKNLEVSTFTYSKLETYFLFHGTESMTKEEAMAHAISRDEMTLTISEVDVTRTPVGDRDWEFSYSFCDEVRILSTKRTKW